MNGSVSGAATDQVYGLLRLGNLDLALPLSALREVVPRPAELAALPVVATGLVGAMGLRSLVLPVVDLRPILELADGAPAEQVVVVVAHEQRVVGLVVDEVRGVTRVPDADLLPFATAEGRLLVSHAFQHEDGAVPVSILDAAELLALPGVPTVAEVGSGTSVVPDGGAAGAVAGDPTESLTLVRCGPQVLALGVDAIHTTIPLPEISPSLLAGGECIGSTAHAGRDVAVVDPLSLLGLTPMAPEDVGAGVVLDLGSGLVVLAVSELVELRAAGAGILRVPGLAAHRPELVLGVVELDEGACLVLDGAGLKADRTLLALASVNTQLAAARSGDGPADVLGADPASGGPAYVTFTAGLALASPLAQVTEILPFPESLTPSAAEHVLGLVVHRGSVVPVVCLSTLLGHPPQARTAASCLLLVGAEEEQVAFAVDALGAIESLTWTDPEHRDRGPVVDLSRAAHLAPLVRLAGGDRLVPALDLTALAAALGGSVADVAAA